MLQEDPMGGYLGTFEFEGRTLTYHVDGYGSPVLITNSLSAITGTYSWRYIFSCLAGTFRAYAFNVTGEGERNVGLEYGPDHYVKLIEHFLKNVIKQKTSIIAGPLDAHYALLASFNNPKLVGKMVLVYPEGIRRVLPHVSIGRAVSYRITGMPKIEDVKYGTTSSKRSILYFLRSMYGNRRRISGRTCCHLNVSTDSFKYPRLSRLSERSFAEPERGFLRMEAPGRLSTVKGSYRSTSGELEEFRIYRNARLILFGRTGKVPDIKDVVRFCDNAIKFLI